MLSKAIFITKTNRIQVEIYSSHEIDLLGVRLRIRFSSAWCRPKRVAERAPSDGLEGLPKRSRIDRDLRCGCVTAGFSNLDALYSFFSFLSIPRRLPSPDVPKVGSGRADSGQTVRTTHTSLCFLFSGASFLSALDRLFINDVQSLGPQSRQWEGWVGLVVSSLAQCE